MARCWAGPLGAVKELDLPSWPKYVPPSRSGATEDRPARGSQPTSPATPQASPLPYPSAAASKVLQRPSAASMPASLNTMHVSGARVKFTPAASDLWHSPRPSPKRATCVPTSEDEQAVSTLMEGPCQSKVNDMRPAATLRAFPVPA